MMKSGFIYDGNVAIASGLSGQEFRHRKRKELHNLGFNWIRTKGDRLEDYNNIDGFNDTALKNVEKAFKEVGSPIIELHNRGLLNQDNTTSVYAIKQVFFKYADDFKKYEPPPGLPAPGSDPGDGNDGTGTGTGNNGNNNSQQQINQILQYLQSQQSGNGSGSSGTPAWLPLAMIGAGGLALVMVLR